jgi:S-adenosylmethionine:tRNA ribosyltransferase-isomerase
MTPLIHPQHLSILDYTYELPEDRIARYPSAQRDAARLLIYRSGQITEDVFANLASHVARGSLLVFNNTKVVEARILFQKPTGARVEVFCLEPQLPHRDLGRAMSQTQRVRWNCLIGGASKWKRGQVLEKKINSEQGALTLRARFVEKRFDDFVIEFSWEPETLTFAEVLHLAGLIPLPPYLKRDADQADAERYQTIYATLEGSVAAPTAGLHFTERVFERLSGQDIQREFVTLHVGAGTFKPVTSETLEQHAMHEEYLEVSRSTIDRLLQQAGKPVLAVGTTALRTIESLYWLGVQVLLNPTIKSEDLMVRQWDGYQPSAVNASESLDALGSWLSNQGADRLLTRTALLIAPGYSFKLTDGLVTNFHQPQSTLLLLVAALIGPDWRRVYQYALQNQFRFLSYGDSSLLFRPSSAPF